VILNSPIERYTYLDTYMTFFKKNTYLYFSIVHKSLLGRLHNYGGAWLRYNYLEGTTIPRSYAFALHHHSRTLYPVQPRSLGS